MLPALLGIVQGHEEWGASRRAGIRAVQTLMGHANVEITMIHLHVINRPGAGDPTPLDPP